VGRGFFVFSIVVVELHHTPFFQYSTEINTHAPWDTASAITHPGTRVTSKTYFLSITAQPLKKPQQNPKLKLIILTTHSELANCCEDY